MPNEHTRTLFSRFLIFIIVVVIPAGVYLRVPVSVIKPATTATDKQRTYLTSASTVEHNVSAAATSASRGGDSLGMNTSTTASNQDKCTNYKSQGYLLAVEFHQQSTGGFLGYSELSKFASLLSLSIVEPYIDGTRIRGVPKSGQEGIPLGTLYNIENLQNTLRSCCFIDQVVSFETMMRDTSDNVIYVLFITSKSKYNFGPKKTTEIGLMEAPKGEIGYFNDVKKWASRISKKSSTSFQLSRIVVVDARPQYPVYLSNITEVLGSIIREVVVKSGSATVVVGTWHGFQRSRQTNFFYYVPDYLYSRCNIYGIQHSDTVIKAAQQFAETLNQVRPVIGVHIRAERLLRDSKGGSYHTDCLQHLKTLLQLLTNSINATRDNVHLFHDLGKYGTTSCRWDKYCNNGKSKMVSQIKELSFPIVAYDPAKFSHFPMGPSFVSFVEREYLSQVDILVTVSRGHYQQSIVDRFLKKSGGNGLQRICE